MRKALIGILGAVIILGTGAYFGWDLWAQFRTKNEVEAVFDSLRTSFPTASHGRIDLYPRTRSLRIADIILQAADRATTVKIGQIIAVGTRGPRNGRVTAGRIEITNWELTTSVPITGGPAVTYKAPSIVIEAFSGPARLPQKINTASMLDIMRASLDYIAASTANGITIPRLTATVTPAKTGQAVAVMPIEYNYSNIAVREIRDRRITSVSVDRATFTSETAIPGLGNFAGAMAAISVSNLGVGAMAAMFDPNGAKDDTYQTIYGRASMGPFEMRFAQGPSVQMDSIVVEDIGIRPSKFSFASILSMADSAPKPGVVPTPEQLRMMTDQVAAMYEGIRIGKFEVHGVRSNITPQARFKLAAMRFNGLENGRLAEFALEGLDGQSPQKEPVHVGRFALLGLNISGLVRQTSQLAEKGTVPSPDRLVALLAMLEGIEFNDVVAPNPGMNQNVRVDAFRLTWGQFVNSIPTNIRLTAKTSVPSALAEPAVGDMLSGSGMDSVDTTLDVGVAWNETAQALEISPVTIELANAFSFTAKLSIGNVPRNAFTIDPGQATTAAEGFEAGPLQFSLRDAGGVKTALTQYAKRKNLSEDAARKEIIDSVNDTVKSSGQSSPDATAVAQAIVQFIENPGSTMTISVTPKGKVNFKQAFTAANNDPNALAELFTVEAKTGQ